MSNKSVNRTEFMSSIGLKDSRKKIGDFKEVKNTNDRKLSRTGLY